MSLELFSNCVSPWRVALLKNIADIEVEIESEDVTIKSFIDEEESSEVKGSEINY